MSSFDRIVEEVIKRAMEAGEFDNLSGTGKPIQWNDNPFTPEEWRITEDLMRKNDLAYPWMEKRKEIERKILELKTKINKMQPLTQTAENYFSNQIQVINKEIFDYNLSVPVTRLQRMTLNIEDVLSNSQQESN
ncbi:MAG: DUF1992 domain-containing protein [Anaerolineaceae bacterium]|nr:DUF1992 domain-containing protein [Anaerolineaceae bacterium]